MDASTAVIILLDREGIVVDTNAAHARRFGLTREEMIGCCVFDLLPAELATKRREAVEGVFLTGKPFTGRDTRSGIWNDFIIYPIFDEFRKVVRVAVYAQDITERTMFEEQLAMLSELIDMAPVSVAVHDLNGRSLYANRITFDLYGAVDDHDSPDGSCGHGGTGLSLSRISQILKAGEGSFDLFCSRKDGSTVPLSVHAKSGKLGEKSVIFSIAVDMSERMEKEDELRKLNVLLTETQAITKVGGWEYDVMTQKIGWTDEVYALYGVGRDFDPSDVNSALSFYAPEDSPLIERSFRRAVEYGESYDLELAFVRANGERIWVRTVGRPVVENGTVIRVSGNIMDVTERKESERALRESADRYRRMAGTVPGVLYDYILYPDGKDRFLFVGPRCREVFEIDEDILLADTKQFWDMIHRDDVERVSEENIAARRARKDFSTEFRIITPSGRLKWLQVASRPNPAPSGEPAVWTGIIVDVTARKEAEEALLHEKERFLTLSDSAPFDIMLVDSAGGMVYLNQKFTSITGYDLSDVPDGRVWFCKAYPDPAYRRNVIASWIEDIADAEGKEKRSRIYAVTCKDGREKLINFITVRLRTGEHMITCDDITEQKELEERLHTLSIVDDLTGIYNRRGFFTIVQQQLRIAERSGNDVLLMFADLDHMKEINDTLGHIRGDEALAEIASVLKETFRGSDILGRIGGDEFAVLVIDAGKETEEAVVRRLNAILDAHNGQKERTYTLSVSIGIARFDPNDPSSFDDLMAKADALMYKEKRRKQRGNRRQT